MGVQDYLYNEFDSEIVEEFLMLLDTIEDNIDLVIEELYSNPEAINDLFRMFHNLKSATAYLKLKNIHNYAHFVEEILDKYRNGKKIDEKLIDWLFDVAEQFHTWYEDIDKNKELSHVSAKILKVPH